MPDEHGERDYQIGMDELYTVLRARHGQLIHRLESYGHLEPRELYTLKGKIRSLNEVFYFIENGPDGDFASEMEEKFQDLSDANRAVFEEIVENADNELDDDPGPKIGVQ